MSKWEGERRKRRGGDQMGLSEAAGDSRRVNKKFRESHRDGETHEPPLNYSNSN